MIDLPYHLLPSYDVSIQDMGDNARSSEGSNHLQYIEALETGLHMLTQSMQALTHAVFELKDRLIPQDPAPANQELGTNEKSNAPSQVPPPTENRTLLPSSGLSMSEGIQKALRELHAF